MKRINFFKNLDLGTDVLSPQLLFSNSKVVSNNKLPEYCGKDGESFKLKLNEKFKCGNTITDDPEYGQLLIVIAVKDYIHEVKLVTNDKEEWWIKKPKGTEMYKISHQTPYIINDEKNII
jgi:hypothetical protein